MPTATARGRRAAIYCRISQDRGGAGLGVARQEADARALCDRLGWEVAGVFCDNDISAFSGKARPGYRSLLDALGARDVDAVVAWHPDRLHRSPVELEGFIDAVEAAHAEVATVTAGDLDLSSANGRMVARIAGAVARHESEHKSERIRRKHLELAEAGAVPGGGRRPFGYEADRVTVRDGEADLIRDAAARILAGDSLRSVVADWNEQGIPSVTGARWSPTTVKRLLSSGRIAGQREHHGQISADAVWPAIITPDQSTRLRALLSDQRRNRAAGVDARRYLLTGFLYCGRCGARMTTRPSNSRGYHYCRYACVTDRGGCSRNGINAPRLDELITETILEVLDTPKMRKAIERRRKITTRTSPVEEVDDLTARKAELAAMFARRELSGPEWKAARAALDQQLAEAKARVVEHTAATYTAVPDTDELRTTWPDLTLERRRAIIDTLIDRITIAPVEQRASAFDPSRVEIGWKV